MKIFLLAFVLLFGCTQQDNIFYYYKGNSTALPVINKINDSTVNIFDEKNSGTGTIFKNTKTNTYILTCAHVIANRTRRYGTGFNISLVIRPFPASKITFLESIIKPILVKKSMWISGVESVHTQTAKIFYIDRINDICLLKVEGLFFGKEIVPYKNLIPIGTEVYHVGNLFGCLNYSVMQGIISHNSRGSFGDKIQVNIDTAGGCSGGGIFTKDTGEYVGMVRERAKSNVGLAMIIPIKKILRWIEVFDIEKDF